MPPEQPRRRASQPSAPNGAAGPQSGQSRRKPSPAKGATSRARPKPKRGRPVDTGKLTREVHDGIVNYVLAGVFPHVAAAACGVAPRTYREWMARGEGRHPHRQPTPKLRAFARDVNKARAEARAAREIQVADKDEKHWLRYNGRSEPGLPGWSEPVPEEPEGPAGGPVTPWVATAEEIAETWNILYRSGLVPPPPVPGEKASDHGG